MLFCVMSTAIVDAPSRSKKFKKPIARPAVIRQKECVALGDGCVNFEWQSLN